MSNIKSCPFCGGNGNVRTGKMYWPSPHHHSYYKIVQCTKCRAVGPELKTVLGAINSWNKRTEIIVKQEYTVYSALSEDDYGEERILRMSLHPMEINPPLHDSEVIAPSECFSFRVAWKDMHDEGNYDDDTWYYSCRGADVPLMIPHVSRDGVYAGKRIGKGTIEEAIAWLLEGEE